MLIEIISKNIRNLEFSSPYIGFLGLVHLGPKQDDLGPDRVQIWVVGNHVKN